MIHLTFKTESCEDAAYLYVVLALGMCSAVRANAVSAEYACDKLFRPYIADSIRELGAGSSLRHTFERAVELEDVASLAPHALPELLDQLIADFTAHLGSLPLRRPWRAQIAERPESSYPEAELEEEDSPDSLR